VRNDRASISQGLGPLGDTRHQTLKIGPHMPYRPTSGLVAFFARTGTGVGLARAPHICSTQLVSPCFRAATYTNILLGSMEGGGQRARGAFGCDGAQGGRGGCSSDQADLVGRGGYRRSSHRQGGHKGRSVRGCHGSYGLGAGIAGGHRSNFGYAGSNPRSRDQFRGGFQGNRGSRTPVNLSAAAVSDPSASSTGMIAQAVALLSHAIEQKSAPGTKCAALQLGAGPSNIASDKGKGMAVDMDDYPVVKETSSKQPYCYRCLTKGHAMKGCTAKLFCDICRADAHITERCPKFRGDKPSALTCSYVMDGLGFYYIPFVLQQRNKLCLCWPQ
jgi:hypothetical protein